MSMIIDKQMQKKIHERKKQFPNFVNQFFQSLEVNSALQTQLEYAKDISIFLDFLLESKIINQKKVKEITVEDLSTIEGKDIQLFMEYLTHYSRSFTSASGNETTQFFSNGSLGKHRKYLCLRRFYAYLIDQKLLESNPLTCIQVEKVKPSIQPRLSSQEMHKIFDAASNGNQDEYRKCRNYTIVQILAYTGIRISELTNMDIQDVRQNKKEMIVTRKGGDKEIVFINDNIREDLYRFLEMRRKVNNIQSGHTDALFLSQRMRRIDPRSVRKMIEKLAVEAGILQKVTPHTFRRTFAWKHYNDFHDIQLTAEILGHDSIDTTRSYYANADFERIASSLNNFKY